MEASEANIILTRLRHLRDNLEELNKQIGGLVVNAKVAGKVQEMDLTKVQNEMTAAQTSYSSLWDSIFIPLQRSASATPLKAEQARVVNLDDIYTGNDDPRIFKANIDPFSDDKNKMDSKVEIPEESSQPSTSGVKEGEINLRPMAGKTKINTNDIKISPMQEYQRKWEKLYTRVGIIPGKTTADWSGKYPRMWMLPGANPETVREWFDFGCLASVFTTAPGFTEITKLPAWILDGVYDSWQNNHTLGRGDTLELKFISAAPEVTGKGLYPSFHFIKLQRPNMQAMDGIKPPPEGSVLISPLSEDDITTRRAWGLWVCLTEMDKVKYAFKFFQKTANGSFMVNTMTSHTTNFAEVIFESKRQVLWNNEIPATKETRRKFCNMAHVGRWTEHICPSCPEQEKPLFGKAFPVRKDRNDKEGSSKRGKFPQRGGYHRKNY